MSLHLDIEEILDRARMDIRRLIADHSDPVTSTTHDAEPEVHKTDDEIDADLAAEKPFIPTEPVTHADPIMVPAGSEPETVEAPADTPPTA